LAFGAELPLCHLGPDWARSRAVRSAITVWEPLVVRSHVTCRGSVDAVQTCRSRTPTRSITSTNIGIAPRPRRTRCLLGRRTLLTTPRGLMHAST